MVIAEEIKDGESLLARADVKKKEKEECSPRKKHLVGLWLTDACNLRCDYCFQDKDHIPKNMNQETLDATIKFVNEIEPMGVAFFGGEPLIAKRQFKQALAEMKVPKFYLTTNGTLLDDDILDWMEIFKVHLNLSLDGMKDTQDRWRDGSYDAIIRNLPRILRHMDIVGGEVLMTMVMESQLYRNVKHVKELGFPSVYINLLDPYGTQVRNEPEKVDIFKEQYRKVITELREKKFRIDDYDRWVKLLKNPNWKGGECGFHNSGLGISPDGLLYPCHRGPELGPEYSFGSVFEGIDEKRMQEVRSLGWHPDDCRSCDLAFNQCPVSCYGEHGEFGKTVHPVHCLYEKAKAEVVAEVAGISITPEAKADFNVMEDTRLIVGTLVAPHKYYILPQFLKNLDKMQFPEVTDYYFILDYGDNRTYRLIDLWLKNKIPFAPYERKIVRRFKTIRIPTQSDDIVMDRITRARNLLLNQALQGTYTHLMWLDSDIIAPHDTVPKLLAVNDAIAGALVETRQEFERETWFNTYMDAGNGSWPSKTDFIKGDIITVDATGCDAVIIRRDVLEDVGVYDYRRYDHPDGPAGEDMLFCLRAKALGHKTRIHTGVHPRHLGIADVELTSSVIYERLA
jgi:uncharacterized protein